VAPERDTVRVNENIRVREVRVIGADGEQLGVMTPEVAIEQAKESGLDLVEVAATSRPPVCRIMDYGRYKYEQKKKKTGKNKQAHTAALKEVKLRPGTDMHDLNFKLNNARRFLMDGDKVKVTVMFRGREMVHPQRGRDQLNQVARLLKPIAKMEASPRMEGRFMSMILVADREAVAEVKRADELEAAANPQIEDAEAAEAELEIKAVETAAEAVESEEVPDVEVAVTAEKKQAEGAGEALVEE
jgi:translation initiation factor IF-3